MSDVVGPGAAPMRLSYRPPFQVAALLRFLRARAIPGVEAVDEYGYRRSVRVGEDSGVLTLSPSDGSFLLAVSPAPLTLQIVASRARRLFDLDADPEVIDAHLSDSPLLRRLIAARPGLRMPGAYDGFELGVRAILGQQVSVAGATTTSGRLVELLGTPIETGDEAITHLFPTAETVASADLSPLGVTQSRRRTISAFAGAVASGSVIFDRSADSTETREQLLALPGIGPWTAEYIAMRALGDPDGFPATDLGLKKALEALSVDGPAQRVAEAWRPYRSYAAMHLWESLSD